MDTPIVLNQRKHAFNVGAVQLDQLAVAQDRSDDLRGDGPQVLEDFSGCGIALGGLFAVGEFQLLKKHMAQLLGAVELERTHPAGRKHCGFGFADLFSIAVSQRAQKIPVDRETCGFHPVQDMLQGKLDFPHQGRHAKGLDLPLLPFRQSEQTAGVIRQGSPQVHKRVGFLLRIQQISSKHGVPRKAIRQGCSGFPQGMQQVLSVMDNSRTLSHCGPKDLQDFCRVCSGIQEIAAEGQLQPVVPGGQ